MNELNVKITYTWTPNLSSIIPPTETNEVRPNNKIGKKTIVACVSYVENPVTPLKGEWVKEASIYFKNDKLKKYADNMSSLYGVNIEK